MGFQDNVNVDVRGAAHIAPCTYKTIILKQNITKQNLNVLTQFMLDEYGANTKFIIKWDYVLGEDITVPANCILEFDGGSIKGEHTLDGNGCLLTNLRNDLFNNVQIQNVVANEIIDIKENNFDNILTIKAPEYRIVDSFVNTHSLLVSKDSNLVFTEDTKILWNNDTKWDALIYTDGEWVINVRKAIDIVGNGCRLEIVNFNIELPYNDNYDYYHALWTLLFVDELNIKLEKCIINGATWSGVGVTRCENVEILNCKFEYNRLGCWIKENDRVLFENNFINGHFSESNECQKNHGWQSPTPTFYSRFLDGVLFNGANINSVGNTIVNCGQSGIYSANLHKANILSNTLDSNFNFGIDLGGGEDNSITDVVVSSNIMINNYGNAVINHGFNVLYIGNRFITTSERNAIMPGDGQFAIVNAENLKVVNNFFYGEIFVRNEEYITPWSIRLISGTRTNCHIINNTKSGTIQALDNNFSSSDYNPIAFGNSIIDRNERIYGIDYTTPFCPDLAFLQSSQNIHSIFRYKDTLVNAFSRYSILQASKMYFTFMAVANKGITSTAFLVYNTVTGCLIFCKATRYVENDGFANVEVWSLHKGTIPFTAYKDDSKKDRMYLVPSTNDSLVIFMLNPSSVLYDWGLLSSFNATGKTEISVLTKKNTCTSSTRPANPVEGQMVFDTTTGIEKPIFYKGNNEWVDATGATV